MPVDVGAASVIDAGEPEGEEEPNDCGELEVKDCAAGWGSEVLALSILPRAGGTAVAMVEDAGEEEGEGPGAVVEAST